MYTRHNILSLVLAVALGATGAYAESTQQVQLKKFRFGQHSGNDFERLVVEFSQLNGKGAPAIATTPLQNGQVNVTLNGVGLVGAIPESAINDAYVSRSKYLGEINFLTDDPQNTNIGIKVPKDFVNVDAFWLENPARLVVDAYPAGSPRARGRDVALEKKRTKKKRRKASNNAVDNYLDEIGAGLLAERVRPEDRFPASKDSRFERVICFPASSQLTVTVSFHKVDKRGAAVIEPNRMGVLPENPVVCYPLSAQLKAKVGFKSPLGPTLFTGGGLPNVGFKTIEAPQAPQAPQKAAAPKPVAPPINLAPKPKPAPRAPTAAPPRQQQPRPGFAPPRANPFGARAPNSGPPNLAGAGGPPGFRRPAAPPRIGPKGSLTGATPLGARLPTSGRPQPPPAANPNSLLPSLK